MRFAEYAAHGNVVIVGRGASAILGARADVIRVFMYGPREWRISHLMQTTQVPRHVAEAELDRIDRARGAYLKDWYGLTFGDSRNYDLCIDTSRLQAQECAALVVAAVRAREA